MTNFFKIGFYNFLQTIDKNFFKTKFYGRDHDHKNNSCQMVIGRRVCVEATFTRNGINNIQVRSNHIWNDGNSHATTVSPFQRHVGAT